MNTPMIYNFLLIFVLTACAVSTPAPKIPGTVTKVGTTVVVVTPPPKTGRCVDFSDQAAGQTVASGFTKQGFVFRARDGGPLLISQIPASGTLGPEITQVGVEVMLPQPASRVVVRTVSHSVAPLRITAYDTAGGVVDQVTEPATPQDTIHTVKLIGANIITLVIEGGGVEGVWVLIDICIDTEPETPAGQCLDFSDWDDGVVDPSFEKDGFVFSTLVSSSQNIVTSSTGERGLQLDEYGVKITLPRPASRVALRVEVHSSPLDMYAFDGNGAQVDAITVPGDNTEHVVELRGQNITDVVAKGGGNAAVLVEICIDTEIAIKPEPQPGATGRIAFATIHPFLDCDHSGIGVMNIDGTGQDLFGNEFCESSPAWSPNGTQIAYAGSLPNGTSEIFVMNSDGSGRTQLTNGPGQDFGPDWSPDGARIAFSSSRDGNSEIYVMNADGSGQTRLTTNPASDEAPDWSPDGAQIVFDSDRDGQFEIYVMNPDGMGQTRLTNNPTSDRDPDWSPDGTQIAFTSSRDYPNEDPSYYSDIYVMNADGSGQTSLTNNQGTNFDPAWSPDGTRIAFASMRDGTSPETSWQEGAWEIYVMNSDGSGQTRLTNNYTNELEPAWQP